MKKRLTASRASGLENALGANLLRDDSGQNLHSRQQARTLHPNGPYSKQQHHSMAVLPQPDRWEQYERHYGTSAQPINNDSFDTMPSVDTINNLEDTVKIDSRGDTHISINLPGKAKGKSDVKVSRKKFKAAGRNRQFPSSGSQLNLSGVQKPIHEF